MNVLMINGSPRPGGNTALALAEMEKIFRQEGIETETFQVGAQSIRGCIACGHCAKEGKCAFDDIVNRLAPRFERADGLVVGSPVYYASANATVVALLDRLFYSTGYDKTMKVGACVLSSRRAGSTSAYDEITKYFTISGMAVASSTYWNEVHGFTAADVEKDLEGLQTMRNLGRNVAFLVKAVALAKDAIGLPRKERGAFTSFPDGL